MFFPFFIKGTVDALKGLLKFMASDEFVSCYGNQLYLNLSRINQDFVESFFACQRQMCGGTQNMTGYTYGYNINTILSLKSTRQLMRKQTNVYDVASSLPLLHGQELLPKRQANDSIFESIAWYVNI